LQLEYGQQWQDFDEQIRAFIDRHWRGSPTPNLRRWHEALLAAGWSVPHWPVEAGGTGWDATQLFLWRRACAKADIPTSQDVGADIIGPMLWRYASAEQQSRWLPGIRTMSESWAIAVAEAESDRDPERMTTHAQWKGDHWVLRGIKTGVSHWRRANWLCCFARLNDEPAFGLFAVSVASAGVSIEPLATLDHSQEMARVTFSDVSLSSAALITRSSQATSLVKIFSSVEHSILSQSAIAQAQLDILDVQLARLDPTDAIHLQRQSIAVELEGLCALELRYIDALQRETTPPVPLDLLRLRSREILLKLGALQMESFGYYALPYPDEMLLHNEGPVGPPDAAKTVRQHLTRQVIEQYEGSAEELRDAVWREVSKRYKS